MEPIDRALVAAAVLVGTMALAAGMLSVLRVMASVLLAAVVTTC